MRLLILVTMILVAGAGAGVVAANAVAGTSQSLEVRTTPELARGIPVVGVAVPQVTNRKTTPDSLTQQGRAAVPGQVHPDPRSASTHQEDFSPIGGADISGRSLSDLPELRAKAVLSTLAESSLSLPLTTTSSSAPRKFVQVSGLVSSTLMVLLLPTGDANLDKVVDRADLLLVARYIVACGPSPCLPPPPFVKFGLSTNSLINESEGKSMVLDWDGDGDVDVVDLAIVAAHLGEQLP